MAHTHFRAAFLGVVGVLCMCGFAAGAFIPSTGDPVALSSLEGEPFIVDDKIFYDFDLFAFGMGAVAPDESTVFVQGGQDDVTGDHGLRFLTSMAAGSGQFVNLNLNFKVAMKPTSNLLIEDVSMKLTGVSANGTGVVGASEYVSTPVSTLLALLSVSKQQGDGDAFLTDHKYFRPVREILVRKDISVSGGQIGVAHLSEFFQYYSQIPEPAGIAVLILGAIALVRRRK